MEPRNAEGMVEIKSRPRIQGLCTMRVNIRQHNSSGLGRQRSSRRRRRRGRCGEQTERNILRVGIGGGEACVPTEVGVMCVGKGSRK